MKKKTKKHVSIEIIEKVMNYNLSFCITFAAFLGRLVLGEERNSFCLSIILEWSVKARGLPFLLKTYVYQRIFQEDI